jgi:hypothetical protein
MLVPRISTPGTLAGISRIDGLGGPSYEPRSFETEKSLVLDTRSSHLDPGALGED